MNKTKVIYYLAVKSPYDNDDVEIYEFDGEVNTALAIMAFDMCEEDIEMALAYEEVNQ